jgi:hypothetical protein
MSAAESSSGIRRKRERRESFTDCIWLTRPERSAKRNWRLTPKPPDLNPLKGLDLTEEQTFGFPSARLGNPSVQLGFPSDWLGIPSAQLGIPSARLGTASLRPSGAEVTSDRLWSLQEEAGLGVTIGAALRPQPIEKTRLGLVTPASRRAVAALSDWGGRRPGAGEKPLLEIGEQLAGAPALAAAAGLQRVQDPDEVLVADALELANG